ncbi:DNA-3-methyladenine glycosylase [Rubripirellula lacrimiformis]|uniref:DNA-3-methyladenine glycosylase II n=1 Tax=Rubripirellula lacrimiformis TaxID=1930273 RepID=A0A517NFJ8_9BACT|nr:DNA-3-methyladenine glycosylase [Rubripirellula lacrimiformis]QDT05897.1 DNA-3-methyladenine glycosylase [Rubripirellula lacrimiformis]
MPSGLDRDAIATAAKTLAASDLVLADVYQRLGPPPIWSRPATFATLIRIILEQQVSLASAKSTFDRTLTLCGGRVTAPTIIGIGPTGLREIGFSRQKARYALALADDVAGKRFRIGSLRHLSDDDVRSQITARLGLGNWSADVFLMMGLGRPDILPIGDLALVKGIAELDGCVYDNLDEIIQRAEPWRPFRSVATRMVWMSYLDRRKSSPQ